MAALALLLLFLQLSLASCSSNRTLHLLALVPLGNMDKEVTSCLDLGEELIPAAEIAAQRINSNPNLLADFTLEIIPASTTSFIYHTRNTTNLTNSNIVGVIGIVHPVDIFSHASLPDSYVQIISSTNCLSIESRIDQLYQIAPSAIIFNKAMIALMKKNSWNTISVIRNTGREHDSIAIDFRKRLEKENFTISVYENATSELDTPITEVSRSGARIIYASVIDSEARDLLCKAHLRGVSWPHYLWVLHSHSLEDLLHNTTECSRKMMQSALDGVLLLHHVVNENPSREIDYADYTYREYHDIYTQHLQNVSSSPTCNKVPQILSPNALHDSVIAFALALNETLSQNSTDFSHVAETLNLNLESVNFNGAGGEICFDNVTHELTANSAVKISQIFNKTLEFLGLYNNSITYATFPNFDDTFDEVLLRLPVGLAIFILVVDVLCAIITIIVLVLYIYYREAPYIKATSPVLSYFILTACFFLYATVGSNVVSSNYLTGEVFSGLCVVENCLYSISLQLLFTTLFWRLLRVYKIFKSVKPLGKPWSNMALSLYIGATVLVTVLLLVLWITTSHGNFKFKVVSSIPSGNPPHFDVQLICHINFSEFFFTLINVYIGVFMVLTIIFAILTRKVSNNLFKDTKAVNSFVVGSIGVLVVFTPISYILVIVPEYSHPIPGYLLYAFSLIIVSIMCISLLFVPKIYCSIKDGVMSRSTENKSSSSSNNVTSRL